MPKKKLIIYGTGSFAEYVSYVFENDSPYEVCGFCMESSVKNPNQHHLFGKPFAELLERIFSSFTRRSAMSLFSSCAAAVLLALSVILFLKVIFNFAMG